MTLARQRTRTSEPTSGTSSDAELRTSGAVSASAAPIAAVEGGASPPAAPAEGGALHVVTFGCQMNKYDSQLVEGRFAARGWRLVADAQQADLVVFNTCSVREHAEERAYSWLGELKRLKAARPQLIVGVMGCMAQRSQGEVFERAAHVDLVCGTRRFDQLPELVDELRARRAAQGASARVLAVEEQGLLGLDRTGEAYAGGMHGYLAVMRGCDLSCTYCIVPSVRGRVASRAPAELLAEARWMVERGCKVITLLGQTVNSYGEDLPVPDPSAPRGRGRQGRPALADLLYALEELAGLEQVRLITLHPAYVTAALARALRECSKTARFLPLPAQSGSDRVLRAMKRGYTSALYRDKVALLRGEVPDLELGSDWIIGFPGEERADFDQSVALLEEIGFANSYVFRYDPRPGTAAYARGTGASPQEMGERNQLLLEAAERAQALRTQRQLGSTQLVFVEERAPRDPRLLRGRTREHFLISFPGPEQLIGSAQRVRVEHVSPWALAGRLESDVLADSAAAR